MKKKILLFLVSILILFAFDFSSIDFFHGEFTSLLKLGIVPSGLALLVIYSVISRLTNRCEKTILFLSALFSFFMVFGNSYLHLGNASLIFSGLMNFFLSLLMAIGYFFCFRYLISFLFTWMDSKKFSSTDSKFYRHPFRNSFLVILLCYLPYIIAFYPIILSPDPSFQIKQFFGIRTKYADYSVLLDENVVLTNHHPVAHTVLLGGCLNIGHYMGNDNFGLFLYSFLQIMVLVSVLSFTISYLKSRGAPSKYLTIMLLIYALVPHFPLYAMSGVKDVFFTAFVILYLVGMHFFLTTKKKHFSPLSYGLFALTMLLVILFRNNGLYMIVLSFPFLIWYRRELRPLFVVFFSVLFIFTCYSKILLPTLKITPGSIREVLSIPFQQTARFVKYHEEDLTKKEIEAIDKVLEYDTLASRYNPELSDPVKNKYNKYTTSEELRDYFSVWLSCLFRNPVTYIDATIANTYGYFYPEKHQWYVYYKFDKRILEDGFDYHYNSLSSLRNTLSSFAITFPTIPIIGWLSNIAISVWVVFLMTGYAIEKKNKIFFILMIPSLVLILTCVASPANTYFRYAMPYLFSLPFLLGCYFLPSSETQIKDVKIK